MSTPITRTNIGAELSLTTGASIVSNAYSSTAMRINNAEGALVADFTFVPVFGTAPVAGGVSLVVVSRDSAGNAGPAPSSSMIAAARQFLPSPSTGNTLTTWIMTCERVPLPADADFWLFNAATGQTIASGAVLTAQRYSPGA